MATKKLPTDNLKVFESYNNGEYKIAPYKYPEGNSDYGAFVWME